ncbi:MAG TPA: Na+/H+ antiporter subunit E [Naasia sp.]
MSGVRHGGRSGGRTLAHQLALIGGLVLLWMLLWGSFTPVDFLAGLAVAALATRVFELPPVPLSGRFNAWYALLFLLRFLGEVIAGSVQVAALALDPRRLPTSAVVEVRLVSHSDLILTLVAVSLSLVPGSVVLEVDRGRSTLFLHVLSVRDAAAIERTRRQVRDTERRILRALGTRAEYAKASR